MNEIKVSVIVPVYNVEAFINRCLNSITNQTLKDIEIILVDDGSPDRCPQICEEWVKRDVRIRLIHKENGGLGFARNTGLDHANGKYVAFVDSDDFIDPQMYELLYREAESSQSDIVYSGFNYITDDGRKTEFKENTKTAYWTGNDEVRAFALDMMASAPHVESTRKYEMSVWRAVYRRSVLEDNAIRFKSERECLSEDIVFHETLFPYINKVAHIPYALYNYCQNKKSLTKTTDENKFFRLVRLHAILEEMFRNDCEALLHVDRMFIENSREYLLAIASWSKPYKREILKAYVSDPVFSKIRKRYKVSYLPLYPRIFYFLELNKLITLIIAFCKLITMAKKSKFYHPYMTKNDVN